MGAGPLAATWPGLARSGDILATAGARKGSTAPLWINASGAVASPPRYQRTIAGDVCIAVVVTCLASLLVLLVLGKAHPAGSGSAAAERMGGRVADDRTARWSGHRR